MLGPGDMENTAWPWGASVGGTAVQIHRFCICACVSCPSVLCLNKCALLTKELALVSSLKGRVRCRYLVQPPRISLIPRSQFRQACYLRLAGMLP